jgi:hypothetical protein
MQCASSASPWMPNSALPAKSPTMSSFVGWRNARHVPKSAICAALPRFRLGKRNAIESVGEVVSNALTKGRDGAGLVGFEPNPAFWIEWTVGQILLVCYQRACSLPLAASLLRFPGGPTFANFPTLRIDSPDQVGLTAWEVGLTAWEVGLIAWEVGLEKCSAKCRLLGSVCN